MQAQPTRLGINQVSVRFIGAKDLQNPVIAAAAFGLARQQCEIHLPAGESLPAHDQSFIVFYDSLSQILRHGWADVALALRTGVPGEADSHVGLMYLSPLWDGCAVNLQLDDLIVNEPDRRRGVAKHMMGFLASKCRARGWESIGFEEEEGEASRLSATQFFNTTGARKRRHVPYRLDRAILNDIGRTANTSLFDGETFRLIELPDLQADFLKTLHQKGLSEGAIVLPPDRSKARGRYLAVLTDAGGAVHAWAALSNRVSILRTQGFRGESPLGLQVEKIGISPSVPNPGDAARRLVALVRPSFSLGAIDFMDYVVDPQDGRSVDIAEAFGAAPNSYQGNVECILAAYDADAIEKLAQGYPEPAKVPA